MPENLATLHAIIYGRVQGVFFRDFVREHAHRLGLSGYVRNLPQGMVEVWAAGDKTRLEELVNYLKIGPPEAKVAKVITSWSEYQEGYSGFTIKY